YLQSEYRAAFELFSRNRLGAVANEATLGAFQNAKQLPGDDTPAARARRAFLDSRVGIEIDVLFGGGSFDFEQHAKAGRLVDSGYVSAHPELFRSDVLPELVGGERYYDPAGRWIGAAVSGFGICYNPDALERLGVPRAPARWSDLADPRYHGRIALSDPSKSGSATKAFEMVLQQQMAESVAQAEPPAAAADTAALGRGFDRGLALIRRIAGNSRYFTDASNKIPQDVQAGSAAAGMCIDFYGRFENGNLPNRMKFVLPERGTSLGSDPIGILRGAPHEELAREFVGYVLAPEGQRLWALRVGTAGGPRRYALRRLPILPALYEPEYAPLRSDPQDNPYREALGFAYHAAWTAPLFRAISFSIRVMCVDAENELHEAWRALLEHGSPPRASALFDASVGIDYRRVVDEIAPTLERGNPLDEVALADRLLGEVRSHYRDVVRAAQEGR
ncbi:MAG TPA: extracellular solute-binding protein, partial [Polyangiaceae bacterium]|nr:extracellular solute-binding protein [Polyangiaceae bacterium]